MPKKIRCYTRSKFITNDEGKITFSHHHFFYANTSYHWHISMIFGISRNDFSLNFLMKLFK